MVKASVREQVLLKAQELRSQSSCMWARNGAQRPLRHPRNRHLQPVLCAAGPGYAARLCEVDTDAVLIHTCWKSDAEEDLNRRFFPRTVGLIIASPSLQIRRLADLLSGFPSVVINRTV